MASIETIVQTAADSGERVVIRAVRETEDGVEEVVEATVDAAGIIARSGERAVSAVVKELARALGGVRVVVRRASK